MRIVILATMMFVSPILSAHAASAVESCLSEAIEIKYEGFVTFQNGLHEMTVEAAPQLAELSKLSRDLQVAGAEESRRQMIYLAETSPDRLVTDKGLSRFVNYDWTEADQAAWLKADPEAAPLEEKLTKLKARNQNHPDWPAMRELYRSRLMGSDKWNELTSALSKATSEAGAALAACP